MMRPAIPMEDSSSSSSDGLFSPVKGRRSSLQDLLTPTPPSSSSIGIKETAATTNLPIQVLQETDKSSSAPAISNANDHNTLPRLHDNSWLGARMSPIPSHMEQDDEDENDDDDDDDDDDDIAIMAPYHNALKQEISFLGIATEETTLLGRRMVSNKRSTGGRMLGYHQHQHQESSGNDNATMEKSSSINPTSNGTGIAGYPQPLEETRNIASAPSAFKRGLGGDKASNNGMTIKNGSTAYHPHPGYTNNMGDGHCKNHTFIELLQFPRRIFSKQRSTSSSSWFLFVPMTTALFLFCVGLHDAFLTYLSYRRGIDSTYSLSWSLPLLGPSERSMIRFGAFSPQRMFLDIPEQQQSQQNYDGNDYAEVEYRYREYWRLLTSALWVTSSVAEWGLLFVTWWWAMPHKNVGPVGLYDSGASGRNHFTPSFLHGSIRNESTKTCSGALSRWLFTTPFIYLLSTVTGQLWMTAFETHTSTGEASISGCTSWGTAGICCAAGMQWPERRFELFVLAIILVLTNLLQTTGSVFGAIGASFFGWSISGVFLPSSTTNDRSREEKTMSSWHYYYEVDDGNYKESASKPDRKWTFWNFAAVVVLVGLLILPIAVIVKHQRLS